MSVEHVGKNIKHLRIYYCMTQGGLGIELEKSASLICAWEKGERIPTTKDLIQLSLLFERTVDDLLKKDFSINFYKVEKPENLGVVNDSAKTTN